MERHSWMMKMSRQRNLSEIQKEKKKSHRENTCTQSGTISAKQTRRQRESEDFYFCSHISRFKIKSLHLQRKLCDLKVLEKHGDYSFTARGYYIQRVHIQCFCLKSLS